MKSSIFTLLLIIAAFTVSAQRLNVPTLSPYSEIKQQVGLTEISLSYARPSAKGRTVFGELVPYGEIWRTGANASTKLTISEDVKLGGNDLPAGTYAIYTIPEKGEWTIIIHKKTDMRSIAGGKVKEENDAFRFNVRPAYNPLKVETFTIAFTDITTESLQVALSWENTIIKFPIEVEVDAKITAQMNGFLESPEKVSAGVYFRAAEYHLHNGKNLDKAMEWIDQALEKSKDNFRYGLLKAKIYTAQENKDMAIKTVKLANQWAQTAKNNNYIKQTEVYLASLEKEDNPIQKTDAYADDVANMDNIISALYDVISGDKGVKRDWDRFRYLFIPEAQLIPTGKNKEGVTGHRIFTPEDYIQRSGPWLEKNGFHEIEISRKTEEYGSLVHTFSTYKSLRSKSDTEPFARGINSIQLMNDGNRWWIVSIYWLAETDALPLPAQYLDKE